MAADEFAALRERLDDSLYRNRTCIDEVEIDTLRRLLAAVEERDGLRTQVIARESWRESFVAERARAEQLAAALRAVVTTFDAEGCDEYACCMNMADCARAALAAEPNEPERSA